MNGFAACLKPCSNIQSGYLKDKLGAKSIDQANRRDKKGGQIWMFLPGCQKLVFHNAFPDGRLSPEFIKQMSQFERLCVGQVPARHFFVRDAGLFYFRQ